jgi:hypothetical protein
VHFGTFKNKNFPSLLAANMNASSVMVGGKLWQFGQLPARTVCVSRPEMISPWNFNDEDVAFVSVGHNATAITITSGKLYMHGHQGGPGGGQSWDLESLSVGNELHPPVTRQVVGSTDDTRAQA